MVDKLFYPKFLEMTKCKIIIYDGGIDETTGEDIIATSWEGKCIFREKTIRETDKNGVEIKRKAIAILEGDIGGERFNGGECVIYNSGGNEKRYGIKEINKPKNPDRSIHHTRLELM